MTLLDPIQLQALVTVSDNGSFTRAAQQLSLTQAAVSGQIRKLEDRLGVRLFDRHPGKVQLTEAGERLTGYAKRLLEINDEAIRALSDSEFGETVRLGVPDDYATVFLRGALASFSRKHPNTRVEVIGALSGPLLDMYEAGQLDLALITKQPGRSAGRIVREEELAWAGARVQPPDQANPLPLALFPEGCVFRGLALDALSQSGRSWSIAYTSHGFAAGDIAVDAGQALTVTLHSMVPARWRTFGAESGLPELPKAQMELCGRGFLRADPGRYLLEKVEEAVTLH